LEYAASVHPGLEGISGREICSRLAGSKVVETQRGWVIFRYAGYAADLLALRTTEDVFALLFRTATLPYSRKGAIPLLERMARSSRHWTEALTRVRQARQRPVKRVTFRVITQMAGKRGFRRQEARDAVLSGVQRRWTRWKPVADDAHLEIWAAIIGNWAAIGLRLSDRKMRHRTYKREHRPASLRPTLAAAMVALSEPRAGDRFCDPMCGTGTILAERLLAGPYQSLLGGDIDPAALEAARGNLSRTRNAPPARGSAASGRREPCVLYLWDARALPLRSGTVDTIVCNLPFGEQIGSHADNPALYDQVFGQLARVLTPGGRAVLLTSEKALMRQCLRSHTQLRQEREVLVGVLGRAARIYVLRRT
jgi:23S rRNA G2445 N2-methylase RlmL